MRTTFTSTAVALSAAALTVGLAGAAHADRFGIDDPRDTGHGSDVIGVQIRNGMENLHVVTQHENLRKDPATGSGGAVYVDTDREDGGPEFVLVGGYYSGTDYVLLETEGFGPAKWGDPVEHGDYMMKVRYKRDRVHTTLSRHAIGDPTEVRVGVRVSGTRTDGSRDGLVDWVGEKRDLTPWIAQG